MSDPAATLFPPSVQVITSRHVHDPETLSPEERAHVARAVARRRREFATGRWCAHRLLASLGLPDAPLLPRPDRAPDWPPDVVGSISHCRALGGAAVGRAVDVEAVGLDLEDATPLDEELWRIVVRPDELDWVRDGRLLDAGLRGKLLFSIKEAVYKCQYPRLGLRLEFHHVRVEIDETGTAFHASIADPAARVLKARLAGRFATTAEILASGVAVTDGWGAS